MSESVNLHRDAGDDLLSMQIRLTDGKDGRAELLTRFRQPVPPVTRHRTHPLSPAPPASPCCRPPQLNFPVAAAVAL